MIQKENELEQIFSGKNNNNAVFRFFKNKMNINNNEENQNTIVAKVSAQIIAIKDLSQTTFKDNKDDLCNIKDTLETLIIQKKSFKEIREVFNACNNDIVKIEDEDKKDKNIKQKRILSELKSEKKKNVQIRNKKSSDVTKDRNSKDMNEKNSVEIGAEEKKRKTNMVPKNPNFKDKKKEMSLKNGISKEKKCTIAKNLNCDDEKNEMSGKIQVTEHEQLESTVKSRFVLTSDINVCNPGTSLDESSLKLNFKKNLLFFEEIIQKSKMKMSAAEPTSKLVSKSKIEL